jgi:hypothetical protein
MGGRPRCKRVHAWAAQVTTSKWAWTILLLQLLAQQFRQVIILALF